MPTCVVLCVGRGCVDGGGTRKKEERLPPPPHPPPLALSISLLSKSSQTQRSTCPCLPPPPPPTPSIKKSRLAKSARREGDTRSTCRQTDRRPGRPGGGGGEEGGGLGVQVGVKERQVATQRLLSTSFVRPAEPTNHRPPFLPPRFSHILLKQIDDFFFFSHQQQF